MRYRVRTVGQFLRLCHHLLRHTRKPVNETCKGHTDAATVFICTLRDTGNLRLWYIKKISFLRHDYHLRSSSYSYSLIFQIPWVKFKDCFSNDPACVARTLGKLSGCLPADASFIEQAFVCRLAGDNICVKALLLFELYNVKHFSI